MEALLAEEALEATGEAYSIPLQDFGMPVDWEGLDVSVGEVWSGPVPSHFCRMGDWTVQSLTRMAWDRHGPSILVWSRSRPGPDPVPAHFIYLFIQDRGRQACVGRRGADVLSVPRTRGRRRGGGRRRGKTRIGGHRCLSRV